MSDNVTKLHTNKPDKKRILILGIAAFVVVLVLLMILFPKALNMDAVGRLFRYGTAKKREDYGAVTFDAHSSNRYAKWKGGLALASAGGLEIYTESGDKLVQQSVTMSAPAVDSGKNITLCYDIGGKTVLALKDGNEIVMNTALDGILFDADISDNDTICIAASESGHKTVLHVYDKNQEEIYRWFSASQFMPNCAISGSGKHLAAVGMGQTDGAFQSTVYFFRTDSEEPQASVDMGGGLIYEMTFVSENKLCALGEDAVVWLNTSGKETGRFNLDTWYLEDYDLDGDGFAMLSLNMYKAGDRCSVVTVDHDGNQLGSLYVGADILDISACGKYAAILTTENLIICHRDLSEYVTAPNEWMATSVLMRDDGTAYLLKGNSAELYIP